MALFISRFQFENDRTQTVIATAYSHSLLTNPIAIVKRLFPGSMRQGKYILIDGFPCFVTHSFWFCIIGIEHLAFF